VAKKDEHTDDNKHNGPRSAEHPPDRPREGSEIVEKEDRTDEQEYGRGNENTPVPRIEKEKDEKGNADDERKNWPHLVHVPRQVVVPPQKKEEPDKNEDGSWEDGPFVALAEGREEEQQADPDEKERPRIAPREEVKTAEKKNYSDKYEKECCKEPTFSFRSPFRIIPHGRTSHVLAFLFRLRILLRKDNEKNDVRDNPEAVGDDGPEGPDKAHESWIETEIDRDTAAHSTDHSLLP